MKRASLQTGGIIVITVVTIQLIIIIVFLKKLKISREYFDYLSKTIIAERNKTMEFIENLKNKLQME